MFDVWLYYKTNFYIFYITMMYLQKISFKIEMFSAVKKTNYRQNNVIDFQ